ncbi:MAG: penicillin-binding protein 2 [Chloroflexi bacterium]|nr:penicillin-binding protein 2 [Chloroflexota bacterium]
MSSRSDRFLTRIFLLQALTVLIFIALLGKLASLQFGRAQAFQERATFNRIRVVRPEGERGVVYDRDGRMLVRNTAAFEIALIPADLPDDPDFVVSQQKRRVLYEELTTLINQALWEVSPPDIEFEDDGKAVPSRRTPPPLTFGINEPPSPSVMSVDEIDQLVLQREAGSAFQPVVVAENLPRDVALRVIEESYRLPGVVLQLQPRREYPTGAKTAEIIGYTGPIPQETMQSYLERGYNADAWVGWSGLEFVYEDYLRGKPGRKVIEVDVKGREQAVLGEAIPPEPGKNLILSLDMELQEAMFQALLNGVNSWRSESAVAVAMDTRTGYILGMVSLPTYDNNIFADGITAAEYASIAEARGEPLINHAISGIYPPGSTFKMVPAAAGLQEGVVTPRTRLNAPGIIYLPNRNFPDNPLLAQPFVCWIYKEGGYHGDVNLKEALAQSCDIYFYKLGGGWYVTEFEGLGAPTLAEYARLFGYGEPTGIDLPAESAGLVPDARWKRIAKGERWVTGDTYNMSIGQGDVLATPLQVTLMTAAVANDGLLFRPQIVAAITDSEGHLVERREPSLIRELPIESKWLDVVREGMWMAVNWEYGTAPKAALPDIVVAGKTGTAEFYDPDIPRDSRGNLPTHAWFTAFAPYEDPEIAVTVFVYNGGEGSAVAAPITRDILRSYFDIKARDEAAGSRTLLERMEALQP